VIRRKEPAKSACPKPADWPNGATVRIGDWLESPYVPRLAARVAAQYHLLAADVPDLLQELLIALWKSDPNLVVGVGWVHRLTAFKALDIIRKRQHDVSSSSCARQAVPEPASGAEAAHLLHARIAHLPVRMQKFWRLRY